jgi:hypothetical protein
MNGSNARDNCRFILQAVGVILGMLERTTLLCCHHNALCYILALHAVTTDAGPRLRPLPFQVVWLL